MINRLTLAMFLLSSTVMIISSSARALESLIERGWMTRSGDLQTFDRPDDVNPIFGQWVVQYGGSLECEFRGKPNTEYQVLVALREMYWQQPDKRIIDIQIGDNTVATADSYNGSHGNPHAVICRGITGSKGILRVVVKPNSASSDQNAVVCGFMLFPGDAKLNVDDIIHNRGPKPLVTVNPADRQNRIPSIADGRLCFGNGYVFGTFVGPLEFAEEPVTRIHDKINRLYLGYSSSQLAQIGLAPCIRDLRSGNVWTVGACDDYRIENGAVIMETKLPVGTVRTETYGAWDKPVLIRRITFTPDKGVKGDFVISTDASLYRDFSLPTDEDALRNYQLCNDPREWPTPLRFPARETMRLSGNRKLVEWNYDNPLYRKVAVKSVEQDATLSIHNQSGKSVGDDAAFTGESAGTLHFERHFGAKGGSLTVVLGFDRELPKAVKMLEEIPLKSISLNTVQKQWDKWYKSGAVVTTENRKLDEAYRSQVLSWKMALDSELGGSIVGGRYHIQTVWTRDSGVGVSVMLDAGHYDDVKKVFRFFADHACWNEKNNCIHANYHASGRVAKFMCGPGQAPAEDLVQSGEWAMQMVGPQLDGMAYYLYNIGKYYRYTGDKAFIKELWPFISKVADALAKDEDIIDEIGAPSGYVGADRKYRKYNPETGLIVENCTESGILREHLLMNTLAVMGFNEAYKLSKVLGEEKPLWAQRASSIDKAIRKYLIVDNGRTILSHYPRPWLDDGRTVKLDGGYFWTSAATVPYFNYKNQLFKDYFRNTVSPDGDTPGWGMWYATLAQAAFEADQSGTGWNYMRKLVDRLPVSHHIYELNQEVTDSNGASRTVTLNLYGFNYLTHAVIRGFAGFGYDENAGHWFFRPQVPDEFGTVHSKVRIGNTWFNVASSGSGDTVAEFKVDGEEQPLDGILQGKYIDGKTHNVLIRMKSGFNK